MLEPWVFLILTLVVYRVTGFLVFDSLIGANPESGSKFSTWLDAFAYTPQGQDRSWLRGKLGDLLSCPRCTSFHVCWIGLCIWLDVWPHELGLEGWAMVWAMAGLVVFLTVWERR